MNNLKNFFKHICLKDYDKQIYIKVIGHGADDFACEYIMIKDNMLNRYESSKMFSLIDLFNDNFEMINNEHYEDIKYEYIVEKDSK